MTLKLTNWYKNLSSNLCLQIGFLYTLIGFGGLSIIENDGRQWQAVCLYGSRMQPGMYLLNILHSVQSYCNGKTKQISGFWSSVGFKIGVMTRFFCFVFLVMFIFVCQQQNTWYMYTLGPYFLYTKYGGEERPYKLGKRLYPYVKKLFKTQHVRNRIDPAILTAIGHRGVSWPSGLAYRTQVLVLAAECGFESRPWHLCPWARHLTIIASLHPGVKWVPVRAELVD